MKAYASLFMAIACVFSFSCFGQRTNQALALAATGNARLQSDNKSNDDLVIDYYHVEETINMTFGRRVTKYEVSKLDMVNTYDLGPHNTRTVTPVYRKAKVKPTEVVMLSKAITDTLTTTIKPIKVEVIAPSEKAKSITIDVVSTYAKVLDKGYKSVEMLKKVADRSYFEGDLASAAKYYAQLLEITTNLDPIYYYRYAQSLKEINETEKADEMMGLFESKNK